MFDARAVLGLFLCFEEKVLTPLRKDGYLNRFNLTNKKKSSSCELLFLFRYGIEFISYDRRVIR